MHFFQCCLRSGSGIDVDAGDIVDNLDGAFVGTIGARKGKWSVMVDLIYLSLADDEKGVANIPVGPGVTAPIDAGIDLEGRVVTLSGARNIADTEQATFDLLVGASPEARIRPGRPMRASAIASARSTSSSRTVTSSGISTTVPCSTTSTSAGRSRASTFDSDRFIDTEDD